jgi:4-methylaminobutanoate oxidase (formaldehyde-forming)
MDSRRFGPQYRSREFALTRTYEVYATYYDVKYPGHERQAGRPLRLSPAYERLVGLGAVFGEKGGWERVNWFDSNIKDGDEAQRPGGCRETAALFDETSFSKLEVVGADAAEFLERVCANRVAKAVGSLTYTQLLNPRGGIECDLTVARLASDRFRIVTGTAFGNHDRSWIQSRVGESERVTIDDVTSKYACFALWGPKARDILQSRTATDCSNDAFGYMKAKELNVGPVPCLAQRVTFVGELGWEMYCPSEYAPVLWDTLMEAGSPHGLVPGGYKAIESLRLEKGYRVWGSDITSIDTPFEAGLGFAVRMDKGDFVGREALEQKSTPTRKLVCLVLDDPRVIALGSEPVRVNGQAVGRITSGGYGYSVERSIAYAYLPASATTPGQRVEVVVFGVAVGAEVMAEPLFDPTNARVRS